MSATTHADIVAALTKVEAAVDAHPGLRRRTFNVTPVNAWCRVDSDGFEILIDVLPANRRVRRHTEIGTNGSFSTPGEAADELIRCLDFWAQAITT